MLSLSSGRMQFFREPPWHSNDPPGDAMTPSSLPPAASTDLGLLHHFDLNPSHLRREQQYHGTPRFPGGVLHSALSCDADGHLSLSEDELRHVMDVTNYEQKERAMLLQALHGLSCNERQPPSPPPAFFQAQPEASQRLGHPRLLRDEGGLFRIVQVGRTSSPRAVGSLPPQSLFNAEGNEEDFESDNFRMFRFKVQLCQESRCHDWAQCPFAHPGEKASRRDPRVYRYSAVPCPDVKRSGKCSRGDACAMAHGVFESWLHPTRYRTQPCKDGAKCPRKVCFFAHSNEELRLAPAAAAAAAADAVAAGTGMKVPSEGCHSPPMLPGRRHLQLLSGAGSPPWKSASPSSILSPISSSPPPSPPTHGRGISPFSPRGSVRLDGPQVAHAEPCHARFVPPTPPPFFPQSYCEVGANLLDPPQPEQGACGGLFPSPATMLSGLSATDADFPALQVGPHPEGWQMVFLHMPRGYDELHSSGIAAHKGFVAAAPCVGSLPLEDEPDLTWVSELIQDP